MTAILMFADNYMILRGYTSLILISRDALSAMTKDHREVIIFVMSASFFFSAITPISLWVYGWIAHPIRWRYFPESFKETHARHSQSLISFQWEAISENNQAKYRKWREENDYTNSSRLLGKVCFANVILMSVNAICGSYRGGSVTISFYEWINALGHFQRFFATVVLMLAGAYMARSAIMSCFDNDKVFRYDIAVGEFTNKSGASDGK